MENKRKSKFGSDNIIGEEVKHNLSKEELKNIEVKTNKVSKVSKVSNTRKTKDDFYDEDNQVTNFIRDEVILSNTPPKNSLSFLIFENNIKELQKHIQSNIEGLNNTDNIGNTFSWTPLYWAVKLRRVECVKLLLSAGVNVNVVVHDLDECCGTVMDLASIRNDIEIEKLLRSHVEKEEVNTIHTYTSLKTRPRGKAQPPSYIFYGNNHKYNQGNIDSNLNTGTDGKK